jgi:hypothetical protein
VNAWAARDQQRKALQSEWIVASEINLENAPSLVAFVFGKYPHTAWKNSRRHLPSMIVTILYSFARGVSPRR